MKKVLFIFLLILLKPAAMNAQNFQSIVRGAELSVQNNINTVTILGDWGEAIIERVQLGYAPNTNNVYQIKISDAGMDEDNIKINAILSPKNSYIYSAEQSKLIDSIEIIDTVSEESGLPVFQVLLTINANQPINAKLGSIDQDKLEINVEYRDIPANSNSSIKNSISNTTNNLVTGGQITFNPDGTPYIVPEEISGVARKGITNDNVPREKVPVISVIPTSSLNENLQDGSGQSEREPITKIAFNTGDDQETHPADSSLSNLFLNRNSNTTGVNDRTSVHVDESQPGPFGKILHETPAFLNLMVLAPDKRKKEALRLSIILNKEKREKIQNKLGMSFRVVNVATLNEPTLKQTTIFYRKRYLKSATIIADAIDGDQKILKMVNPSLKEGVDIEIILKR